MHIYNWYHSITTGILLCTRTRTQFILYMAHSPCFLSPLADSHLLPFSTPLYLLGTLLAVTGSVHLVPRLLVNYLPQFPHLAHIPPLSKIPTPRGFPDPNIHSLGRHCEPGSQDRAQLCSIYDQSPQAC
jgi:hypothetical protein